MSTPLLLLVTLVLWVVVEWLRIVRHQATISADITAFQKVWPTFALLYGLVVGLLSAHWFWITR